MAVFSEQIDNIYRIITQDSADIQIGQVVYFQDGQFGTSKGLLLTLTNAPTFIKKIKVAANNFQRII